MFLQPPKLEIMVHHLIKTMLNVIITTVLALITGLAVNAGEIGAPDVYSHPTLKQGLLAWYGFDGNFNDAHGALNAQIANGSPAFGGDRFGHPNGAFQSAGGNALTVSNLMIGGGSFTIQFWALNPTNWFLGQGIRRDNQGLHIGVDGSGMRCDYWGSCLSVPLSEHPGWTHWVMAKSIWRDGQCVARSTAASYAGSGPLIIGRHFSGGGFFIGSLDEVAFWDRALTPSEIADLYAGGKGIVFTRK
jgi:hypothetical protein